MARMASGRHPLPLFKSLLSISLPLFVHFYFPACCLLLSFFVSWGLKLAINYQAMDMEDDTLVLPPGFRFHPTDEEIITHYLSPKVLNHDFCARAMGDVDLNKCEPWDLPSKAKMGEKEWYFFCQRDRKYPTGMRTNRATESGYWKATGKDKEIYRGKGFLVGMKKTLVFYKGRAPKGHKSNWVMHEFRLQAKLPTPIFPNSSKEEWVVCRVFHKNTGLKRMSSMSGGGMVRINSFAEDLLDSPSLPRLMDAPYFCSGDDIMGSSYFSSSGVAVDADHDSFFANINPPAPSSSFLQQVHADEGNSYFSMPGEFGCLHREQHPMLQPLAPAIRRHCKAEQFSNQSMLSQDTGVSTDRNTEISSVVYEDFDRPPASSGVLDLHSMWRC